MQHGWRGASCSLRQSTRVLRALAMNILWRQAAPSAGYDQRPNRRHCERPQGVRSPGPFACGPGSRRQLCRLTM